MDLTKNGTHKRTAPQRKADLATIERWIVRGLNDRQIADKLAAERPYRISRVQVWNDRHKIEAIWRQEMLDDADKLKRQELQALRMAEIEAWTAWEKSKLDAERKTIESVDGGQGKQSESGKDVMRQREIVVTEGRCGDVAYLRHILDIQARRAKMLGLDAPTKSEVTGADGAPLLQPDIQALLDRAYPETPEPTPTPQPKNLPNAV